MSSTTRAVPVVAMLSACALTSAAAGDASCERLTSLTIASTAVTSATLMAAGRSPGLPAFCLVKAVSKPTSDSEIHIEVWLPVAKEWNGKFLGTGNGGYSGALGYRAMEGALRQGYAAAGSDTGHEGEDLSFGISHPEKVDDWAWRATHVMTKTAGLTIRSYYGRFAAHSYFAGCSTGGQQALTEAQRFPDDYDGIVAGAPGNNRIRLNVGFLWNWRVLHRDGAEPLPASKLSMIHTAVVAACDALDGIKDGLISEPRRCTFDPGALLCKGADQATCLTESQVSAVRRIYDGARNARTGARIFAGWERGSETGWGAYFVGHTEPARIEFWRYWVFSDPNWDPDSFDFDKDVAYADAQLGAISANDSNLTAFREHRGKLVMYQGWADPVVPPEDVIRYYESVGRTMGAVADFYRLFMVPGMSHCAGGAGPDSFDALGALDQWVTQGIAPDRIIASHSTNGKVDRTRPLCPWPQVARWKGSGSTDDAAQFVCASY